MQGQTFFFLNEDDKKPVRILPYLYVANTDQVVQLNGIDYSIESIKDKFKPHGNDLVREVVLTKILW